MIHILIDVFDRVDVVAFLSLIFVDERNHLSATEVAPKNRTTIIVVSKDGEVGTHVTVGDSLKRQFSTLNVLHDPISSEFLLGCFNAI